MSRVCEGAVAPLEFISFAHSRSLSSGYTGNRSSALRLSKRDRRGLPERVVSCVGLGAVQCFRSACLLLEGCACT